MRSKLAASRLAREGFVPAGPEKRVDKRAMLAPKTTPRPEFIPALPEHALIWLAGELGPAERRAMREIAERGDLAEVNGQAYLVAPVSAPTIDALAAFEAEGEDRENDLCDEEETDDDRSNDDAFDAVNGVAIMDDFEPDEPEARERFIAERRATGRSG